MSDAVEKISPDATQFILESVFMPMLNAIVIGLSVAGMVIAVSMLSNFAEKNSSIKWTAGKLFKFLGIFCLLGFTIHGFLGGVSNAFDFDVTVNNDNGSYYLVADR